MFELLYSNQALKQLEKLEKSVKERIIRTLERIRIRPVSHVKKLVSSPYFRLRVGDYRVILNIKNDEMIILVIEVGHRRNVYK
ncbi:type II toxin-antitoxin system RelE/ParE family toxin [Candidatus Woesearchaeota archaeon]|nr:type II toxin-antitoxin system RelE/ParE family toxin [Candidatus Woesearchaeota archaeon]